MIQQNVITPEIVAQIVECSPITVRRVIAGKRNRNTPLGQNIYLAKILLEQGAAKLFKDVKIVCTHSTSSFSNTSI